MQPAAVGVSVKGQEIIKVAPGSQAEKAGVQPGWLLIKIDGKATPNNASSSKVFPASLLPCCVCPSVRAQIRHEYEHEYEHEHVSMEGDQRGFGCREEAGQAIQTNFPSPSCSCPRRQ